MRVRTRLFQVVTVPTGFGMSAIFFVLPLCASVLLEHFSGASECYCLPCDIVISPLLSLMADQGVKLRSVGITLVLQLSEETSPPAQGSITHIFSSPESLLAGSRWRKLLLEDDDFVNSIMAIVVDEVHCIVKW